MDDAVDHEETIPLHTVIDLAVIDYSVSLTLMCRFVRFCIEVKADDLTKESANTGLSLHEEFIALCDDWEDRQEDLEDWVIKPCLPFLGQLAPMPAKEQVFTLEEYYQPPTYCYRLHNSEGSIAATQISSQDADLPRHPNLTDLELTSPELKQLPHFSAADFEINRTFESDGFEFCDVPQEVRWTKEGLRVAFKAAEDSESLHRELQTYMALQTVPRGEETLCIQCFYGIVRLQDKVLGLVLEYIDHNGAMFMQANTASQQEKMKWFRQINNTVTELHRLGLVWGDANPDNVLVRNDGNICVHGFGGGFQPEWIDQELCDSQAGDLQALERMKAWLDF